MHTTSTPQTEAAHCADTLPPNFDPQQHPILARHWFGLEPSTDARSTVFDVPEELFDLWEDTSSVGYFRTELRRTYWRQAALDNRLPAERGVIVVKGGRR